MCHQVSLVAQMWPLWLIATFAVGPDASCDASLDSKGLKSATMTVDVIRDTLEGVQASNCVINGAEPTGKCSLRAAILAANKLPRDTTVTILLPSGSIILSAPLPEVLGTLAIIGFTSGVSLPATLGSLDHAPSSSPADRKVTDKRGSTINGRRRYQILRTGPGSHCFLKTLELVNGRAAKLSKAEEEKLDSFERARAPIGGALNALGDVAFDDVALRRNTAEYGGAVYFEGRKLTVLNSVIEHNVANMCGGAIYIAGGASAAFNLSEIRYNYDSCHRRTLGNQNDGDGASSSSSWLPWPWASGGRSDDLRVAPPSTPPDSEQVDLSGAIAQGPIMTPSFEPLLPPATLMRHPS